MSTRTIALSVLGGAAILASNPATSQDYPSKVVRVLTSTPGSTNDIVARMIAQGLSTSLRQPVIVDNRGSVAAEIVARAEPDGHVLLFYGGAVYLQPMMRPAPYDPAKDLAPVTAAVSQVTLLVVHPSLPVKSTKELIALAKARPGELNFGAGTVGAPPHLAGEQFKLMTGIQIERVSYKGTGPSVLALYSGEVVVMFVGMGSVAQHIKSGRLRSLAVTTPKRSPLVPELPTVGESVPGYFFVSEIGMYAPGRTPAPIINTLQREVARVLANADIRERLLTSGIDIIANSPHEYAAMIKADIDSKKILLKQLGLLRQ